MSKDMTEIAKPTPRIDRINRTFFDGCNEERLIIQQCEHGHCGRYVYYPRVCCPHCHGNRLTWRQVSGAGRVISHTTIYRPHHPGFYPDAPYVFAAIQLDEGPLIYATLPDAPISETLLGRPVVATFVPHAPDQKLLAFCLAPQD